MSSPTNASNLKTKWPFLSLIASKALEYLGPCRVLLFGSRATEKNGIHSDFDIAVDHQGSPQQWANFVVFVKESPVTLYDIDLVDLRDAAPHLLVSIQREGILLNDV